MRSIVLACLLAVAVAGLAVGSQPDLDVDLRPVVVREPVAAPLRKRIAPIRKQMLEQPVSKTGGSMSSERSVLDVATAASVSQRQAIPNNRAPTRDGALEAHFAAKKPTRSPSKSPTKKPTATRRALNAASNLTPTPLPPANSDVIRYFNGPIMENANVYLIWYGTWTQAADDIITPLLKNVGGSDWYRVTWATFDKTGARPQTVAYKKSVFDRYSQGNQLSDNMISDAVRHSLDTKAFPVDPQGVYFVLTSADLQNGEFCNQYCGWHSYLSYNNVDIKFAMVGSPAQCMGPCGSQPVSPNGDPFVDTMATTILHELTEAVTDPVWSGWWDSSNQEIADKCIWNYGPNPQKDGAAYWNMQAGGRKYYIQTLWVNVPGTNSGKCVMSLNDA